MILLFILTTAASNLDKYNIFTIRKEEESSFEFKVPYQMRSLSKALTDCQKIGLDSNSILDIVNALGYKGEDSNIQKIQEFIEKNETDLILRIPEKQKKTLVAIYAMHEVYKIEIFERLVKETQLWNFCKSTVCSIFKNLALELKTFYEEFSKLDLKKDQSRFFYDQYRKKMEIDNNYVLNFFWRSFFLKTGSQFSKNDSKNWPKGLLIYEEMIFHYYRFMVQIYTTLDVEQIIPLLTKYTQAFVSNLYEFYADVIENYSGEKLLPLEFKSSLDSIEIMQLYCIAKLEKLQDPTVLIPPLKYKPQESKK